MNAAIEPKVLAVLAGASGWAKVYGRDGSKYYGIRSTADPNRMWLANAFACDCPDRQWHSDNHTYACKHMLAVRAHVRSVLASRRASAA